MDQPYPALPVAKKPFFEDFSVNCALKNFVDIALFAHSRHFCPKYSGHPLCLVLYHNRKEELSVGGAYFDDSGAVESALSFDFHFVDVEDVDVEEGFGGEDGCLDGLPISIEMLEDFADEEVLLEVVRDVHVWVGRCWA